MLDTLLHHLIIDDSLNSSLFQVFHIGGIVSLGTPAPHNQACLLHVVNLGNEIIGKVNIQYCLAKLKRLRLDVICLPMDYTRALPLRYKGRLKVYKKWLENTALLPSSSSWLPGQHENFGRSSQVN